MKIKNVLLSALVCAFLCGCESLFTVPQSSSTDDENNHNKELHVVSCDTVSGIIYAIWVAKDTAKVEEFTMYGDLSIHELYEDFVYETQINGKEYLFALVDVYTRCIIGWNDANGDDENYRLMQKASRGMLTPELIERYLK